MKEQDAAHSFEERRIEREKSNHRYNAIKKYLLEHSRLVWCTASACACMGCVNRNDHGFKQSNPGLEPITEREYYKITTNNLKDELTRLRSELQDTKSYYENKLDARQRIIDRQFSELQQKDEVIKELMRFAFEVRNSTNLNQDGKVKVIKINSIIERATKIIKQS